MIFKDTLFILIYSFSIIKYDTVIFLHLSQRSKLNEHPQQFMCNYSEENPPHKCQDGIRLLTQS